MAAAVAGERGRQTNQGSPLSFGSDMTFMEMATPHRGVVDFLCQACHRVSSAHEKVLSLCLTKWSFLSIRYVLWERGAG